MPFAVGFAAAWALGGKTREQLAGTRARATRQAIAGATAVRRVR